MQEHQYQISGESERVVDLRVVVRAEDYELLHRIGEALSLSVAKVMEVASRQYIDRFLRIAQDIRASNPPSAVPEADSSMPSDVNLPRRLEETLRCLREGLNEKQIASKLELSRHTVHVYVKSLYRRMGVNSKSQLLARVPRFASGSAMPTASVPPTVQPQTEPETGTWPDSATSTGSVQE